MRKNNVYARQQNKQRRVAAAKARAHEIRMWPMVCAVAHAAVSGLVTSVPIPLVDMGSLEDDTERALVRASATRFQKVAEAWVGRGLRAMPLCELVAVVSRLQWE